MKIELKQGDIPPFAFFVITAETNEESIVLRNIATSNQSQFLGISGIGYGARAFGQPGESVCTHITIQFASPKADALSAPSADKDPVS